jgi:uncharacterized protein YndB with AHSA1/START domain
MTVTSVDADLDSLTLTLVADFTAPAEKVWDLWADPRKLERWWGPPGYPATFSTHELTPGASSAYYMTSPDGEKYPGWWTVQTVSPPTSLTFIDGFSHPDGTPNTEMPVTDTRVSLTERQGGTRMELVSTFASRANMDQVMAMGMQEGLTQAVGQMDALLD